MQQTGGARDSDRRTILLILSYLWILAVIPLATAKEDREIQWHARHGLVLLAAEILLATGLFILSSLPLGWVFGCALVPLSWLAIMIVHLIAIQRALRGGHLEIPLVTDFADRWS